MLKKGDIEKVLRHRFPEAVALIVSKSKKGQVNLCPVGYFSLVSYEPKIWGVGLYEKHFSNKVISETKEFVLCLPAFHQVKDVMYCGKVHGWKIDKTKKIKLQFQESKYVQPPLVEDSIVCFECKVVNQVVVGDHTVFFGKIMAAYESNNDWKEKIYNWEDKTLGVLKLGDKREKMNFDPVEESE